MKKLILTTAIILVVSCVFSQVPVDKTPPALFYIYKDNFDFTNGKVKEIHFQMYHTVVENGKFRKGEPVKFNEVRNVISYQPWSCYFDKMGRIYQTKVTDDDGNVSTRLYHYENDKVKYVFRLWNSMLFDKRKIVYLNNGNIEKHSISLITNEITAKTIDELDKNGNLLKEYYQNSDGNKMGTTCDITRYPDGKIKTYSWKDPNGFVYEFQEDFKYNEKGLVESMRVKITNGEEVNYGPGRAAEYEYDDKGNWISRITGWRIFERTIVYYD